MVEKNILSIENHYFGCINLFKTSIDNSYIKIFSSEIFKKMSFKNRCVVMGSNGLVSLSIPIANGRDQKLPMKEVRIANNEDWQKVHWRTIASCYGKSPFWEFYADYFAPFFVRKYDFLLDLNRDVLMQLWKLVDKKMQIIIEDVIPSEILYGRDVLPKNYQTKDAVVYTQIFSDRIGFQPNLSMLDLLCMEGPNTANLLRQNKR